MKCARCGEEITIAYIFEGKAFGYTCIKVVNPSATKKTKKNKEFWVKAERFEQPEENKIVAYYTGNHYKQGKFVDYRHYMKTLSGILKNTIPESILIQDGEAYINLLAYKTGYFYL